MPLPHTPHPYQPRTEDEEGDIHLLFLCDPFGIYVDHVECSNSAVKAAFDIQVNGKCGSGRPKMTWKQLTERDHREWKLPAIHPHDRNTWRSGVRSAMRAASQLPGRGPTVVDMAPIPAR